MASILQGDGARPQWHGFLLLLKLLELDPDKSLYKKKLPNYKVVVFFHEAI